MFRTLPQHAFDKCFPAFNSKMGSLMFTDTRETAMTLNSCPNKKDGWKTFIYDQFHCQMYSSGVLT
jgi:hypothetical protein